jgi:hypothetical protein
LKSIFCAAALPIFASSIWSDIVIAGGCPFVNAVYD